MAPLVAEIGPFGEAAESRARNRRTLSLQVAARRSGDMAQALVHNLSESGFLVETSAALAIGDAFDVELPEAGVTQAAVVWKRGAFLGCRFERPLSRAAVSASLLRSPGIFRVPAQPVDPAFHPDGDYEDRAEGPVSNGLLFGSLILGLLMALGLITALLRFPA